MFSHGAKDVNTRVCALEGSELFGSTKQKLDFSFGVDCDSHWSDKVNYSIACLNGCGEKTCIEESLNYAKHGVLISH